MFSLLDFIHSEGLFLEKKQLTTNKKNTIFQVTILQKKEAMYSLTSI
jgi:hypothetical protein